MDEAFQDNNQPNPKNKFRKKSKSKKFLSNAKGFAKQGIYGRGAEISDDQFKYFVNILDAMKLGFESKEEKCAMANNVFEQSEGNEIHFSSNQVVSKAFESLIGFTSEENLSKFMDAFSKNFRPICSDSYASHVLQKMIEIAFLRAVGQDKTETTESNNTEEESSASKKPKIDDLNDKVFNTNETFSKQHKKDCRIFVGKIGKFMLNNLEDFMWDVYASHIMRTSILCLSGICVPKIAFDQNKDLLKNVDYYEVPSDWIEIAKEFPQRIELWPQFSELAYSDLTSAFLSTICLVLKHIDKNMLKHLGKKILVESFLKSVDEENSKDDDKEEKKNDEIKLPKVFYMSCSIRLLETLITVAGPKLFTQLYAMLFPGKLITLSLDKSTNFAVQKIIDHVKEKQDFESIFEELKDQFEEILKIGHTGVMSSISNACLRLQTKQGAFIGAIQAALHANSKENSNYIFKCLIKLKPCEIAIKDNSQFVHLHGSLIVQNILKFNKPIFLVNCILNCTSSELVSVFNTPNGSYIADAFLESKFIGEKSREKLIKHMEGTYIDLAVTKFGSKVLEKFFEHSHEQQKMQMVKQLAEKINQLNGTMFGRIIYTKFRVETYKLSANAWKNSFNRANKAEKMFKDIINK